MQNGDVYSFGNYNGTASKYDETAIMTLQDILKTIANTIGVDLVALI